MDIEKMCDMMCGRPEDDLLPCQIDLIIKSLEYCYNNNILFNDEDLIEFTIDYFKNL